MKWIGIAAFLFGVGLITFGRLRQLCAQEREMEQLLSWLRLLARQIRDYETPLPRICAMAQEQRLFSASFWAQAERLGLRQAFLEREEALTMPKEVCTLLDAFFESLGKRTREVQNEACAQTLSELEGLYRAMREQTPKKKKLCTTVSVCLGLSVLILLL